MALPACWAMIEEPLLRLSNLACHLNSPAGTVRAVDGVSLDIAAGTTLGLVGESGCGKSTLARAVLGLTPPTAGEVLLAGASYPTRTAEQRRRRARLVQMVFQDPFGSLNPRLTVGRIIEEPLLVHGNNDAAARLQRTLHLLDRVGLPASAAGRYPHEMSGGQRQRVAIARVLALEPKLIICDEPVSALDVSIQAQVLNLLCDLQRDLGLTLLFISHDIAVVRYIADRIAVMYRGKIVETGTAGEIWSAQHHPYTRTLLAAIPPDPDVDELTLPPPRLGEPESAAAVMAGCRFRPRCPVAMEKCTAEPGLLPRSDSHSSACWHEPA